MHLSASAAGWIALGAAAVAVVALLAALAHSLALRRVRKAQLVLLGGGKDDLVDFAVSLQARIDDLHRAVDEVAAGLARVDRRGGEAPAKTPIVPFDPHEGTSGPQPASGPPLRGPRRGVRATAHHGPD